MKVETKSGFKFDFDDRILEDWRLVEAITDADSDDPVKILKGTRETIELLFGENKEKLMDHIAKKNDGYVPTDKIREELFDAISKAKNSSSSPG